MASIAEKFRKIRIAPALSLDRQGWIDYVQNYGWVWSDERSDWSITLSTGTFWGQELTIADWREKIQQYLDEHRETYGYVTKTGTYELLWDAEANAYYYVDGLGKKIYDYSKGQNIQTDVFIGETIKVTPNYDFKEAINDILGNPIVPKNPQAGLYETKNYFDLLTRTRQQYKAFWSATNKADKIKALEDRATDIVEEEGRMIGLIAIAQKAKTTDNAIINTVSVVASLFGGTTGKASGVSIKTAVSFAQKQTTDKRIQLIGQDLQYINTEYEAIKAYFEQNNANLNVTASSSFSNWLVKNWGWIIAAAVSLSAMIYFIRKRNNTK